jgi:hypothetical protein
MTIEPEPKRVYKFKEYTELRYRDSPIDRTTFLIGKIKCKNGYKLLQVMMTRNETTDIPTNQQRWLTRKVQPMKLKNVRDDNDYILMDYFEIDNDDGDGYIVGAEMCNNELWTDEHTLRYEEAILALMRNEQTNIMDV